MKISSTVSPVGGAAKSERSRPAAGAPQSAGTSAGTEVDLSPLSNRLQEIQTSASADAVVDTQRVSEIKQAIAEGRFKVNPERIADGLLDSVRQMLAKTR